MLRKFVLYLLVNKKSPRSGAALPSGAGAGEQSRGQQQVEVSVRVYDDSVVSTELQQVAPEASLHFYSHLKQL